jgi:hypothetical protein
MREISVGFWIDDEGLCKARELLVCQTEDITGHMRREVGFVRVIGFGLIESSRCIAVINGLGG